MTIPADKTPKFDDKGKVLFKKKVVDENGNASIVQAPATSTVLIDSTQIQLAVNDMTKHAKTEYIEFAFGASGSFSQTGHMGTKTKMSKSALLASVYGEDVSFILPPRLSLHWLAHLKANLRFKVPRTPLAFW